MKVSFIECLQKDVSSLHVPYFVGFGSRYGKVHLRLASL